MRDIPVSDVIVDATGRLVVVPSVTHAHFALVYRAATGVAWVEEHRGFASPVPEGRSHLDWFQTIVAGVANESGMDLVLTEATRSRGAGQRPPRSSEP